MNTDKLIDAAHDHARAYDGDDRECIATDVLNAFYAGAKFGEKAAHEECVRAMKDMLPFVANNRKQNDRNIAAHQLRAAIEKLPSN
jgi:hypothetical protein